MTEACSNSNAPGLLRESGFHVNEREHRCDVYYHGTHLFRITRPCKREDWRYRGQYRTARGILKEAKFKAERLDRIAHIKHKRGY